MISLKECLKRSEIFVAGKGTCLLQLSFFLQEDKASVNRTDEEMAAAISAVRNGMAIKRAAEEHGVLPSML